MMRGAGKIAARFTWIGAKKLDWHPSLAAHALGGGSVVGLRPHITDQGCQAAPQARPRRLFRHGGFSREIVHFFHLITSNCAAVYGHYNWSDFRSVFNSFI